MIETEGDRFNCWKDRQNKQSMIPTVLPVANIISIIIIPYVSVEQKLYGLTSWKSVGSVEWIK